MYGLRTRSLRAADGAATCTEKTQGEQVEGGGGEFDRCSFRVCVAGLIDDGDAGEGEEEVGEGGDDEESL